MRQTARLRTQKYLHILNLRTVSVSLSGEKMRGTSAWNPSVDQLRLGAWSLRT
jgi:hypothetical protein